MIILCNRLTHRAPDIGPRNPRVRSRAEKAFQKVTVTSNVLNGKGATSILSKTQVPDMRFYRLKLSVEPKQARKRSVAFKALNYDEGNVYSDSFLKVRIGVFLSILLGYSCYYLTRNSLTFTAPAMVATPGLGLDITSIGVITSIFPLCYGCSKFVSGVVGDVLSPV